MILRFCLVFAIAALAHAIDGMDEDMAELAKMMRADCVAETGVDISLLDQVNGGADLTDDPKLKCYIKCTMETAGMMSEGKVEVEAVLALLPDALRKRSEKTIKGCGTKTGSDDCDTAYKTQVCWQQGNKKDYFLI